MSEKFAEVAFNFQEKLDYFEEELLVKGEEDFDFTRLLFDDYDCSVEVLSVPPNVRLTDSQQKHLIDNGFLTAYLNHWDGWQTHYNFDRKNPSPVKGWRVKYALPSQLTIERIHIEEEIPLCGKSEINNTISGKEIGIWRKKR